MSICLAFDENGYAYNTGDTVAQCTHYVAVDANLYNASLSPVITPLEVAEAFTWGFGVVVALGYFSGYYIGVAKTVISKL